MTFLRNNKVIFLHLFIYSLAAVYAKGIHSKTMQILFCLLPCFEESLLSLDSHPWGIKDKNIYLHYIKRNSKRDDGFVTRLWLTVILPVTFATQTSTSTALLWEYLVDYVKCMLFSRKSLQWNQDKQLSFFTTKFTKSLVIAVITKHN